MTQQPLILITNDDGIHAKGMATLVDICKPLGQVVVVAPERANSAKSHSVTINQPVNYYPVDTYPGTEAYAVTGTPVDSVKMALGNILTRKPDFVFSGINHGSNAAINVIYSGTMAAAIEGASFDIPSVGFSLTDHNPDANFEPASSYVRGIIKQVMQSGLPHRTCLNVNIPNIPEKEIQGVRICRQTKGYWNDGFTKRQHPAGFHYYWLTGRYVNEEPEAKDTDEWALRHNYVAVVPVQTDLTNYQAIDFLNQHHFASIHEKSRTE